MNYTQMVLLLSKRGFNKMFHFNNFSNFDDAQINNVRKYRQDVLI